MSYIITDFQNLGTMSDGKTLCKCYLECDTTADLPTNIIQENIRLAMGTTAHIIETNSIVMLNSSGVWIVQLDGVGTYTKEEIDKLIPSMVFAVNKNLTIADNLDNYMDAGNYTSQTSAITGTILNKPSDLSGTGFKLIVYSTGTNNKIQIIYKISQSPMAWIRGRTSSGWGAWVKFIG